MINPKSNPKISILKTGLLSLTLILDQCSADTKTGNVATKRNVATNESIVNVAQNEGNVVTLESDVVTQTQDNDFDLESMKKQVSEVFQDVPKGPVPDAKVSTSGADEKQTKRRRDGSTDSNEPPEKKGRVDKVSKGRIPRCCEWPVVAFVTPDWERDEPRQEDIAAITSPSFQAKRKRSNKGYLSLIPGISRQVADIGPDNSEVSMLTLSQFSNYVFF